MNGFVSEFLTILGAFTSKHLGIAFGVVAALGIILGAVYMLHMVACVIFGPLKSPLHGEGHGHARHAGQDRPGDIDGREIAILTPLAIAVVLLGVLPNIVLTTIEAPVSMILRNVRQVETVVDTPKPSHREPAGVHRWLLSRRAGKRR